MPCYGLFMAYLPTRLSLIRSLDPSQLLFFMAPLPPSKRRPSKRLTIQFTFRLRQHNLPRSPVRRILFQAWFSKSSRISRDGRADRADREQPQPEILAWLPWVTLSSCPVHINSPHHPLFASPVKLRPLAARYASALLSMYTTLMTIAMASGSTARMDWMRRIGKWVRASSTVGGAPLLRLIV